MRYTNVNLYQSTCTKQPIPRCTKQPVINLYHKQVHQPCTKYVRIMHQIHINYDSSRCTNIVNYKPHVCANSSTTCLNLVPNMYLNQNPSSISSSKSDLITYTSNTIPQVCTSNHVLEPHFYTTSICTNNFSNIPQPKSPNMNQY